MVDFNYILTNLMYFFNHTFDELFYFVPSVLKIVALTLLISMINISLDKDRTKSKYIVKVILNLFFGIYCFLRIVPIANMNFNISFANWEEIFILIMNFIPYLSMLILVSILKSKKIVKFFLSYHFLHLFFILTCMIWNYINPEDVELVAVFVYATFTYGFSIYNYRRKD